MLELPDVTLVIYDAVAPKMSTLALAEITCKVKFFDIHVWAPHDADFCEIPHQFFKVPEDSSKEDGQAVLWNEVPKHITTSHILNIEWDSGLNDVLQWTDEFLEYDYIGAPWPWHQEHRVGNGGFALMSARLMQHVSDRDNGLEYAFPWDDTLCRKHRPELESRGFKWAEEFLAEKFSLEHGRARLSFGFHDCRNFPRVLSMQKFAERCACVNDYIRDHKSWREVQPQCPRVVTNV